MSIEQFLIKKNIAKDEKGAQKIMIIVIGLCILFFIIRATGGRERAPELSPEEQELINLELQALEEQTLFEPESTEI